MISLSDITDAVADHYHMSPDTLLGRDKARRVSVPRQMAYALSRDLTEASLSEIGRHHGINRMAERHSVADLRNSGFAQGAIDAAMKG